MKQSCISNPARLNEHLSRKCCRWSPLNLAGVLRERLQKCLMSWGSKRPSSFLHGQEMVNSRFLMQKGVGTQSGLRPPSASLMCQSPIIVRPQTGNSDDFHLSNSEFYQWDLEITRIAILTRRRKVLKCSLVEMSPFWCHKRQWPLIAPFWKWFTSAVFVSFHTCGVYKKNCHIFLPLAVNTGLNRLFPGGPKSSEDN